MFSDYQKIDIILLFHHCAHSTWQYYSDAGLRSLDNIYCVAFPVVADVFLVVIGIAVACWLIISGILSVDGCQLLSWYSP